MKGDPAMKTLRSSAKVVAALLATVIITGCGMMDRQSQHGPGYSQGRGPMMGGGSQMDRAEMKEMCDRYDRMAGARTPEERMAMMDERMRSMSPEMRQQQLEMMRQQCRGARQ